MDRYMYPSEWLSTQRQQGTEYQDQSEGDETGTHPRSGAPLAPSLPSYGNLWLNPPNVGAPGPSARLPAMVYPQAGWAMPEQSTTPYYSAHVLPASNEPIPERDLRIVSGGSIIEPDSVFDEESGMTFQDHPTARYMFPNDPAEQDRADLQHKIFRMYNGGALHRAPVGSPRNVLEIATGTGLWAIQYAAEHPGSKITGSDISRIQPSKIPDNCSFIKEDSEHDEWIFQEPFDFIYMRMVSYAFDDYPNIFRKCFDNLEPGGWLELNDSTFVLVCDDGSTRGTNIEKWSQRMSEAQASMGRDPEVPKRYRRWMVEAGFVDVVEQVGLLPGAKIDTEMMSCTTLTLDSRSRQPVAGRSKAPGVGRLANDKPLPRPSWPFLQAYASHWDAAASSRGFHQRG